MGIKTKIERIKRELDKRKPVEPVVIRLSWVEPWPDGEEVGYQELVINSDGSQVINLKWPEDED